jgi:hypothetical protein
MTTRVPVPESWSVLVDEDNVSSLPVSAGFIVPGRSFRARPIGFQANGIHEPAIVVYDESGKPAGEVSLDLVPNMLSFQDWEAGAHRLGQLALLRHRKGGMTAPEPFWRVLRLTGYGDTVEHRPAEIRYGQHPDHPEHLGFYVGAQHVGNASLQFDVEYLRPSQVAMKYFPLLPRPFED